MTWLAPDVRRLEHVAAVAALASGEAHFLSAIRARLELKTRRGSSVVRAESFPDPPPSSLGPQRLKCGDPARSRSRRPCPLASARRRTPPAAPRCLLSRASHAPARP